MDTSLPMARSAQKVQSVLDKAGLTCRVVQLPRSTRTAVDAAASIGCTLPQIVKSLIFKTAKTGQPVLILASGPNRVSEKKIRDFVGENIVKADASFTRDVTGYAIGGIPPVGHAQKIDFIFIDETLLDFEDIWAAAGTPNAVFCLQSQDLVKLTQGKVVGVS